MANRLPSVDDASYQFPTPIRQRNADNSVDPSTVEGAALRTLLPGAVNVTQFGATGDGTTDDAAAIQAAIDQAVTLGAGAVVLPPGNYVIGSRIILKDGTHLIGFGNPTIHRKAGLGTMVVNWVPGDTTTTGYNGPSNITVEGVTFDAHGDTQTANPANILGFGHARNIRVVGCTFLRTSGHHALEFNAVDGAYVEGCRFYGFAEYVGLTEKEAVQIDSASPGDYGAADDTPAKNVTIIGCDFAGYDALPGHHVGVGSHNDVGGFYDNIRVIGCTFADHSARGVGALAWRGSLVGGCTVEVTSGVVGIRLAGCDSSVVSGCHVSGAGLQGVSLTTASSQCKAVGCSVNGVNEGLYLGLGAVACTLSGNSTKNTPSYGVITNGASDSLVVGNTVEGAGYTAGALAAIRVSNTDGASDNVSVTGNKVLPHGAGTEVSAGVSVAAGVTNAWVFGNDFLGLSAATSGTVDTTSNRI